MCRAGFHKQAHRSLAQGQLAKQRLLGVMNANQLAGLAGRLVDGLTGQPASCNIVRTEGVAHGRIVELSMSELNLEAQRTCEHQLPE